MSVASQTSFVKEKCREEAKVAGQRENSEENQWLRINLSLLVPIIVLLYQKEITGKNQSRLLAQEVSPYFFLYTYRNYVLTENH